LPDLLNIDFFGIDLFLGADIFGLVRDNPTNMHMAGKRKVGPTIWYPQKFFFLKKYFFEKIFLKKFKKNGFEKNCHTLKKLRKTEEMLLRDI